MINTNEFIGLRRAWGAFPGDGSGTVDCCLLAAEIHKRLGYYDYTPDILKYFQAFTDSTFPPSLIPRWLLQNADRIKSPRLHAIVLMRGKGMGALGTVLEGGQMLYISAGAGVVLAPAVDQAQHFFWLRK
jgi:hypothetical protein